MTKGSLTLPTWLDTLKPALAKASTPVMSVGSTLKRKDIYMSTRWSMLTPHATSVFIVVMFFHTAPPSINTLKENMLMSNLALWFTHLHEHVAILTDYSNLSTELYVTICGL